MRGGISPSMVYLSMNRKLFENGNSPTKVFGIDSELIIEVERKHPHIANHNSMRNEGLK